MSSRSCVTGAPVTVALSTAARLRELTPSRRASSWSICTRTCRAGLHPVEVDVPRARVGAQHAGEVERDPPHLVLVGPADPVLQRPADRRSQLERRDARDDLGKLLGERLLELLLQPLARREVPGDDDELPEERIGELDVQRQDEADRTAPDVAAEVVDVLVALEQPLEALHDGFGRVDRRVLAQRQVDRELRAIGRREELLRNEADEVDGDREQRRP